MKAYIIVKFDVKTDEKEVFCFDEKGKESFSCRVATVFYDLDVALKVKSSLEKLFPDCNFKIFDVSKGIPKEV